MLDRSVKVTCLRVNVVALLAHRSAAVEADPPWSAHASVWSGAVSAVGADVDSLGEVSELRRRHLSVSHEVPRQRVPYVHQFIDSFIHSLI